MTARRRARVLTDREVQRERSAHFDRLSDDAEPIYFHGGVPGLKLGDRILPPSRTGVLAAADFAADHGIETGHVRRDRVYLTTEIGEASVFAAMHPSNRGEVYVVEPLPPVEPDPDYLGPGRASWMAAEALVIRRLGGLDLAERERIRATLRAIADPAAHQRGRRR